MAAELNKRIESETAVSRMHLELDVWREACRHVEIAAVVDRIALLLARSLPVDSMLMRRIERQCDRLTTVAVSPCPPATTPTVLRTDHTSEDTQRLIEWARVGRAQVVRRDAQPRLVRLVLPPGIDGAVLCGPLVMNDDPLGVLVLVARHGYVFSDEQVALVQRLLEPLTVALENDRRFHEMARLREAVEADNRALLSRLHRHEISDAVVGQDSGLKMVMERVEQVASTNATVLILGETGTGKEVVARTIHARSHRAANPIVRVNCGAIPPELVDSELFGHEKGSFTGAVSTRQGWFERADGGTLFLDEIGELPLAAQVRLLRILQDGSLERVGGQRPIAVDVRVIAATHRNLESLVVAGSFRSDLWYRINVFPIRLPSLRERPEDIPALAAHFARRAGLRLGGAPLALARDDVPLLVAYSWPGNVRELASVIERAAILGDGRRLEIRAALGADAGRGSATVPVPQLGSAPAPASEEIVSLDRAMGLHIERALRASYGRIEGPHGAARLLGINPHTLRARMRKLDIDWRRFRPHDAGGHLMSE